MASSIAECIDELEQLRAKWYSEIDYIEDKFVNEVNIKIDLALNVYQFN
jgi:hypothetical protein